MYERSSALLDDAFTVYSYTPIIAPTDIFEVKNGTTVVKACVHEEFSYPLLAGEEEWIEINILPFKAGIDKEIVGQIQITLAKRLIFSGNLYKL